jgi:hypothetical protein
MKIESLKRDRGWIDFKKTREGEKNTYYVCTSYENNESHEVFIYYSLLGAQGTKEVENPPY